VRWAALREQFGTSYSELRFFRLDFPKMLAPAVVAYPEARVEIEDDGVVLHPSPVAAKVVALGAPRTRRGSVPIAVGG
jgi:hypothetical protein